MYVKLEVMQHFIYLMAEVVEYFFARPSLSESY